MALKKIIQRPTPVPIYSSHSLIYSVRPHFLQLKKNVILRWMSLSLIVFYSLNESNIWPD